MSRPLRVAVWLYSAKAFLPTSRAAADILKKYTSVTELAILFQDSDDTTGRTTDLISHRTVHNATGNAPSYPQLSQIDLGCLDENRIDYPLYVGMLQSRWKAGGCALRGAALLSDSGPGPDAATLRAPDVLRREGMDICIQQGIQAEKVMNSWTHIQT